MDEKPTRIKKKINLLGDPGVGKTSLILRFVKNVFGDEYLKTIGTNVYTKEVEFSGGEVKLVIQDIMGETQYTSVQEGAFLGSTGAIAVVDIVRPETLSSLVENWLPRYYESTDENNPVVLAVNKFDLEDKKITPRELDEFYEEFESTIFTSAKTGRNVEYMFKSMAPKVAHSMEISVKDLDDIIGAKELETPQDLLDALLTCCSLSGKMSHRERERLLEDSGIIKYDLEGELFDLNEDDVLEFACKLVDWYKKEGDEDTVTVVNKAVDRY